MQTSPYPIISSLPSAPPRPDFLSFQALVDAILLQSDLPVAILSPHLSIEGRCHGAHCWHVILSYESIRQSMHQALLADQDLNTDLDPVLDPMEVVGAEASRPSGPSSSRVVRRFRGVALGLLEFLSLDPEDYLLPLGEGEYKLCSAAVAVVGTWGPIKIIKLGFRSSVYPSNTLLVVISPIKNNVLVLLLRAASSPVDSCRHVFGPFELPRRALALIALVLEQGHEGLLASLCRGHWMSHMGAAWGHMDAWRSSYGGGQQDDGVITSGLAQRLILLAQTAMEDHPAWSGGVAAAGMMRGKATGANGSETSDGKRSAVRSGLSAVSSGGGKASSMMMDPRAASPAISRAGGRRRALYGPSGRLSPSITMGGLQHGTSGVDLCGERVRLAQEALVLLKAMLVSGEELREWSLRGQGRLTCEGKSKDNVHLPPHVPERNMKS